MPCNNNIVDENLDFCPTDEVAAGTSETEIYGAFISDFDVLQEPTALDVATSYAQAAEISAAHTFQPGKGFFKLNILPDTGKVSSTLTGNKGSKSFVNSFAGTISGTSARNLGFGRRAKNAAMVWLIKEANGNVRQLGGKTRAAYFQDFNPDSGATPEDINGIPFNISDVQAYPAPVYTGAITEFTPA